MSMRVRECRKSVRNEDRSLAFYEDWRLDCARAVNDVAIVKAGGTCPTNVASISKNLTGDAGLKPWHAFPCKASPRNPASGPIVL
jgi:hypothetical protein